MKKIYFLGLCLLAFFQLANAQDKLISVDFHAAKIQQFVDDLQAKTGYHFYYEQAQFDSLKVTVSATDRTLSAVLFMVFDKTDYHFAIVDQNVFLTKGREMRPNLAAGFFAPAPAVTQAPQAVVDYSEEKTVKVAEATTEN
ncbi:MAG: hypothetical protein JST50_07170, partial [Bacteroidetes bacterium]|nr:hypothetical protein [Bacteroidota bacterium]